MRKQQTLTYGRLYEKLKSLGFEESALTHDGKQIRVFEHPDYHASRIILPDRPPEDIVETFYMNPVLMILRRLELLPETNPLLS
jgi:hypothetical protein